MAALGGRGTQPILRSALEPGLAVCVSVSCGTRLVSHFAATQPENATHLGADAPFDESLAAPSDAASPLSTVAHWRPHLRQEPDALATHVRICGGVFSNDHSYSDKVDVAQKSFHILIAFADYDLPAEILRLFLVLLGFILVGLLVG
jgi:pimeloyl-ACP methyl ester carboxylesterase